MATAVTAVALVIAGPALAVVPSGPTTNRISGTDRYDTSVQLAKAGYPSHADTVFIATGTNYPDALAAGPTAAAKHGPLLLTDPAALPTTVATELTHLSPATVVIVGGTSAVSNNVKNQIHALLHSATITRLAGTDRYDTARQVVRYGFPSAHTVYVATGANYPDALSAAADGGGFGQPVVLVNGAAGSLDSATKKLFSDLDVLDAIVVGGTAAVSAGIASSLVSLYGSDHSYRIAGADRFATSALLADGYGVATHAYLATGYQFPDALAGSALAASQGAPLLTVQTDCVPATTLHELTSLGVTSVTLIGGTSALTANVKSLDSCDAAPTSTVLWSTRTPMPAGVTATNAPAEMSCPAANYCVAVAGPQVVDTFTGSTWSPVKLPLPSGAPSGSNIYTSTIDCPTTSFCAIEGQYATSGYNTGGFVSTRGSNGVWNTIAAPVPASTPGASAQPSQIDCVLATSCTVVGAAVTSSHLQVPYALYWNGSSWRTDLIPPPSGTSPTAGASADYVSCPDAEDCVAAGHYTDTSGFQRAFVAETLSGPGGWSSGAISLPSDAQSNPQPTLTGLSCAAYYSCALIGGYTSTTPAGDVGFVDTLSFGGWSSATQLVPGSTATEQPFPYGVSCWTPGGCLVVGTAFDLESPHGAHPIAQSLYNGAWSLTSLPEPSGTTSSSPTSLDAVSCTPGGDCVAAGDYQVSTNKLMIETRHNGVWSVGSVTPPQPQNYNNRATSISCSADGFCAIAAWNVYFL